MTRDDIRQEVLTLEVRNLLLEFTTGLGKTRTALEYMNKFKVQGKILVVIPRLILIDGWKKEIIIWGFSSYLPQISFTTYVSLPKHVGEQYDLVIYDEAHHLSERAREAVEDIKSDYNILLSATVKKSLKKALFAYFPGLHCQTVSMKQAIDDNILPDPRVFLLPLTLDNTHITECIKRNPSAKGTPITLSFKDRFKAKEHKGHPISIPCTQSQYYEDLNSWITFYERQYRISCNECFKFKSLQLAKQRLDYLASLKDNVIKNLLRQLEGYRTLTFCSNIAQTEALGEHCINSKNENSTQNLADFNDGKINHITACNMLNEGANLTDCQVGIFVSINSSDIMVKQKNGRILRHPEPILFFVYYKGTREEEIINEMITNYNPELITVVTDTESITLNQ